MNNFVELDYEEIRAQLRSCLIQFIEAGTRNGVDVEGAVGDVIDEAHDIFLSNEEEEDALCSTLPK
jgi:hypothetical protein